MLLEVDEFRDSFAEWILLRGALLLALIRRPLIDILAATGASMKPCEDDGISEGFMIQKIQRSDYFFD